MREQQRRAIAAFQTFITTPLNDQLEQCRSVSAESTALALFDTVANTVPAYKAFLQEHRIDPASVQTLKDFQTLPLLTKENYLSHYPLADRQGKRMKILA